MWSQIPVEYYYQSKEEVLQYLSDLKQTLQVVTNPLFLILFSVDSPGFSKYMVSLVSNNISGSSGHFYLILEFTGKVSSLSP